MKLESRRAISGAVGIMVVCLLGLLARGQSGKAGADPKPQMSEEVFKIIQVLRGIPVNEFMGTMGFFSAALGMNCTDCHVTESAGDWNRYADDTPLKNTARRMVLMENLINRADFGNDRMVTCYTCHRGVQHPEVTPSLAEQYGTPPPSDPDRVEVLPNTPPDTSAAAQQILDKYIQAIGGAQQLAKFTSYRQALLWIDTFKSTDRNFSQAPNQHSVTNRCRAAKTTADGNEAWLAGRIGSLIAYTGGDLDCAGSTRNSALFDQAGLTMARWLPAGHDGALVRVVEGTAPGALA